MAFTSTHKYKYRCKELRIIHRTTSVFESLLPSSSLNVRKANRFHTKEVHEGATSLELRHPRRHHESITGVITVSAARLATAFGLTSVTQCDIDKAAALINVARKTLENRLAGLKREHRINAKATSGIRKAAGCQRLAELSPKKRLAGMEGTIQKATGHTGAVNAGKAEQSDVSAER